MKNNCKIYNLQALNFLKNNKFNIGLLGGSFNPAHQGHLAISLLALKKYKLDYVIWLVANQNPFKPKYQYDITKRAKFAAEFVKHPRIIISTLERDLDECQTYKILSKLTARFKNLKFTWLMGIDNIEHFHLWENNQKIKKNYNMIIFDRSCRQRMLNLENIGFRSVDKNNSVSIIIDRNKLIDISSTSLRLKNNKYER